MDSFGMQPSTPVKKTLGPPTQLYLPPKDNKKKTLIIVLCVCAVILALILGAWIHHINSPAYRVQKGILNLVREMEEMKNPLAEKTGMGGIRRMMAEEGFSSDTKLNVTFDTGSYYLGELTLGVDTTCEKDVRRKEMSTSTTLSLMNYEFGHVEMYGDRENLCFSCPEFLLEDLYIENENVLDQYNHSVWGMTFGEVEGDDFSIDLFADQWLFADDEGIVSAFFKEYAGEIAECKRHMDIERAGQDLYRVSFDNLYFNELVRQVLYDYVDYSVIGREEAMGILSYFDVISNGKDVSFLLEINRENQIESIRLEEPLSLYQGNVKISGDVYFLGAERSVDKMQGKIEIKSDWEEETEEVELTWQVIQSLVSDDYQMESNIRCSTTRNGEKQNAGLDIDLGCDGRKNTFETEVSFKSPVGELALTAEGDFSHIQTGESFDMDLDEVVISLDDEEILLIRGEIGVEPLAKQVKQNAKPKTAFFELDEDDWYAWMDDMFDEYDYLLGGMFW